MNQCAYPGCKKNAYPGGTYCSRWHRDTAPNKVKICEYPECDTPALPGPAGYCSEAHRNSVPGIIKLDETDEKYTDILNQFQRKWLHNNNCPDVLHIYKVLQPRSVVKAYENYRSQVESRGRFQSRIPSLEEGNQRRRFHGTKRACNLGDDGSTTLCSFKECSLCGIIRTSFKLSLAGTSHPWHRKPGRFGRGIYTSATSSKSNDYSKNLPSVRSSCKAMLLAKVVVGEGEKLSKNDPTRKGPSLGHDSMIGEPNPKQKRFIPWLGLNYDELVVYQDCAAIPAYLIIYKSP